MNALSTIVEYIARPFRKIKQLPARPARPESKPFAIYTVQVKHWKGVEQFCACSQAGWPIHGFGDNQNAAQECVDEMNKAAAARIMREKAEREQYLAEIHARRKALRPVRKYVPTPFPVKDK